VKGLSCQSKIEMLKTIFCKVSHLSNSPSRASVHRSVGRSGHPCRSVRDPLGRYPSVGRSVGSVGWSVHRVGSSPSFGRSVRHRRSVSVSRLVRWINRSIVRPDDRSAGQFPLISPSTARSAGSVGPRLSEGPSVGRDLEQEQFNITPVLTERYFKKVKYLVYLSKILIFRLIILRVETF
jgi:hypothetical protein